MLDTKLSQLYVSSSAFATAMSTQLLTNSAIYSPFVSSPVSASFELFIFTSIYNYYYDDIVAYEDSDDFVNRLAYDVAVKYGYWYKKFTYIQDLFRELDLMQSSKMTSSSNDKTSSVGGTLQKTANTPTGVTTESDNVINLSMYDTSSDETESSETLAVTTDYVDKYTNYEGKVHSSAIAKGERSATIERQGDIETLLRVLEKLPSSFADEITKYVSKHFIQDYNI